MNYRKYGAITGIRSYNGSVYISNVPEGCAPPKEGDKVKIGFSEQFSKEFTIKKWKTSKTGAIAAFKEIDSDSEAFKYKEQGVFVDESALSNDGNEKYFIDNLVGCAVIHWKTGEKIGEIIDVWLLPANDVWLTSTPAGELPIPVIDDVVKSVDMNARIVKINPIDGLMDLIETSKE